MKRYNIPFLRASQALPVIEAPAEITRPARWPDALPKSRPSAVSAGAAILLHVAAGAALLTVVRLPVVPKLPDEQTVELVFAPPEPVSPEPVAPAAVSDPAPPPETPAPPPEVLAPPPPSPPEPRVSAPEPSPSAAVQATPGEPPPATRARVAQKPALRPRSVAPPHSPERPTITQPVPADASPEPQMDREWQRALAGWLAAHKTYPDEARRSGTEGNVVLRFTIDRSGRVLDVMLVRSAGSSVLDSAAEAMVRNATLPPFTPGMSRDTVTITVQIHYALAN
ncbi:MAG: TonB family protein [Rhodopila sp.]